jgi:guanylate kinase
MEMYDYVVVNDEVEEAVADLECIRTAEKNRLTRRTKNGVTNSEQRLRQ